MRERYVREGEEAGYIKRNVPMFDMQYLSKLISAADAVISPMSTLLLEALILEKPTLAIAFGDGKHRHNPAVTSQMTHFAELRKTAALVWCGSSEQLVKQTARLLQPQAENVVPGARAAAPRYRDPPPRNLRRAAGGVLPDQGQPTARKQRGRRTGVRRNTISHAYGAHVIASEYCGIDGGAPIPGYWMHGWIPAYHNVDPALIALHKKGGQHQGYDFDAQIREEKRLGGLRRALRDGACGTAAPHPGRAFREGALPAAVQGWGNSAAERRRARNRAERSPAPQRLLP